MDLIIPNADFSAVKIGKELSLNSKTSAILAQVTGVLSDQKKIAFDNIVTWIIENGYENSVARMIIPFAAGNLAEALHDVWANNSPAFNNPAFDPSLYASLSSGALIGTGSTLADSSLMAIAADSLQNLNVNVPYSSGAIQIGIGSGGILNGYSIPSLSSGSYGGYSSSNASANYALGYNAANRTDFIGKLVAAFGAGKQSRYFNSLTATTITSTTGTLAATSSIMSKVSTCIGHVSILNSKMACLIAGDITDDKLVELKALIYALHLLL